MKDITFLEMQVVFGRSSKGSSKCGYFVTDIFDSARIALKGMCIGIAGVKVFYKNNHHLSALGVAKVTTYEFMCLTATSVLVDFFEISLLGCKPGSFASNSGNSTSIANSTNNSKTEV